WETARSSLSKRCLGCQHFVTLSLCARRSVGKGITAARKFLAHVHGNEFEQAGPEANRPSLSEELSCRRNNAESGFVGYASRGWANVREVKQPGRGGCPSRPAYGVRGKVYASDGSDSGEDFPRSSRPGPSTAPTPGRDQQRHDNRHIGV